MSRDVALALGGAILAIVLIVLDKAGKLKGPVLLVLLGVAAVMTLPLALSNSWVAGAATGTLRLTRGMLMVFSVGVIYSGLAVWISIVPPEHSEASQQTLYESTPHRDTSGSAQSNTVPKEEIPKKEDRTGMTAKSNIKSGKVKNNTDVPAGDKGGGRTTVRGNQYTQNIGGSGNLGIQGEQINIGHGGRIVPPGKYQLLVDALKKIEKGTAALVVFEPVTDEMKEFGGQLQSAFRDAGWELPGYSKDISRDFRTIVSGSGSNDVHRNIPDGLHCVTTSQIGIEVVQALSLAGIKCEPSTPLLYPPPKPEPSLTIFMGRDLSH